MHSPVFVQVPAPAQAPPAPVHPAMAMHSSINHQAAGSEWQPVAEFRPFPTAPNMPA